MLIFRPGSRQFYDAFFNTYQICAPLFGGIAGLFYFKRGYHSSSARRFGWLLIALACFSFAIGQCTWTYLESLQGVLVPFPSLADIGYMGTYPLLIAGVFLLFGSMPAVGRTRRLIDSAIAASSLGVISWFFVVQRLWLQSEVTLIGKIISIAYPLSDIAALFGAFVLLSSARQNRLLRRSLYFLAAGIFGFTFFDTSFTWMSLNGTYRTGSWSDWTVSFGWILVGYSFLMMMWWIKKKEQLDSDQTDACQNVQVPRVWQMIAPYAAVAVACFIVGITDYSRRGSMHGFTIVAMALLMLLVIARQILALIENRSLTMELKSFNANLEKTVAERTEDLESRNKTILAMVEERNRFYRHVSHEVRTPLTSIIGFSEVLLEDEEEPLTLGQKAVTQKVVDSGHRLLDMINNLLDISRAEAGKMEVNYSKIKLDMLIEQVADNIAPLISEKALNLNVNLTDNIPVIVTDEQKLTQILTNLLSNAIKYTHEGTISIGVTSTADSVSIKVEDTGVGIPQNELENIFKEFHRVQVGPPQRGSGLGLAIVQKFTDMLGGSISVQSSLGAGSTFTLTLPVTPQTLK